MNFGIFIGLLIITISLFLNYINLFCTYKNKVVHNKHWVITYYVSWCIAIIPFFGLIIEVFWLISQIANDDCIVIHPLFKEK